MAGSISDPEKFYHFEIACQEEEKAGQLKELIRSFSIDAKVVERKKYYVVYVKEGAQIVELLGLMGAGDLTDEAGEYPDFEGYAKQCEPEGEL